MANIVTKNPITSVLLLLILIAIVGFALKSNNASLGNLFSATRSSGTLPCKCYCSDKCGPRDRKASDTPFTDAETGLCFCAPRDKANYIPNGCILQANPGVTTCCS